MGCVAGGGLPVRISTLTMLLEGSGSSVKGANPNLTLCTAGDSGKVRSPTMHAADSDGASTRSMKMDTTTVESCPGGATNSVARIVQGAVSSSRRSSKLRLPTFGVKAAPTPALPIVASGPRLVAVRCTRAMAPGGTVGPPGSHTSPLMSADACAPTEADSSTPNAAPIAQRFVMGPTVPGGQVEEEVDLRNTDQVHRDLNQRSRRPWRAATPNSSALP